MKPLRRFVKRLSSFLTSRRDEERLHAEVEDHIAFQTDEQIHAGFTPAEARRQALLKFGGIEAMKELYRDQRGLPTLEMVVQDTRHALRRLRLAPAFTIATTLTLALGIGATTSIFTLAHALLLKSLPVANPSELYRIGRETHCCYLSGFSQQGGFSLVSYDLYRYLRDHSTGFSELAAVPSIEHMFGVRRLGTSDPAQPYYGEFVSGNYFNMFGLKAYAGRVLRPQDDQPGVPPVAVMSYRLWQQRYAGDPTIVGGTFNLNGKALTVVGIAPPAFFGDTLRSSPPDLFLPLNTEPVIQTDADLNKYDTHWLNLIGRIRPGVSPAHIEAEMRVALKQWLRSHWGEMSPADRAKLHEQTLFLSPGGAGITSMREQYEHWLRILMAVTAIVLLIVCGNVANLMLVRGMERRRQTSLTAALGARPLRLLMLPLAESILLSISGGVAGLGVAFLSTRLILRFAFPTLPGLASVPIDSVPSLPVLIFAFVISLATGLAFSIAPAWMAVRADPIESLRGASRSTARSGLLPRKTLVVFQSALSLGLLSAAGLLTTALQSLENQNLGFEKDRRFVATINPRLAGYKTAQLPLLYRRIHDSIAGIPGVDSVAICLYSPPGGGWGSGVWIDGRPASGPAEENAAEWDRVSAGFFDVVGTPVVQGRGITEQDTAKSRKIAVVSETFARRFFRNQDPIGKHFGWKPDAPREFEIVGVAKDARYWPYKLTGPRLPMFFLPEAQADYSQSNIGSLFLRDIVILTRPGARVPLPSIEQAMASVDSGMPVISIESMTRQVAAQFADQRLIARLTTLFGGLSLLLASIGLYGVMAYNAGRRTSEIGVRMALGAARADVVRLVLRGAFALIVAGLLIGLPLTFALGRLLGTQLYGLSPYDPVVMTVAILSLCLSALLAAFIPAFRASRISPLDALRTE